MNVISSRTPRHKTRVNEDNMFEVFERGVSSDGNVTFETNVVIPGIAMSSNIRYCNVVQIAYELVVETSVSGCHKNVVIIIPVTIGSVALNFNNTYASSNQTVTNVVMPSAPTQLAPAADLDLREFLISSLK